MFLDASAVCAMLLEEVDSDAYADKVEAAEELLISPIAVFETVLAIAKATSGDVRLAQAKVATFLQLAGVQMVAIAQPELDRALDAFERYGKGRHRARLNLGDCFAYACAATNGVPLLFKGDDFSHTDITAA